jgi:hypothetical protein
MSVTLDAMAGRLEGSFISTELRLLLLRQSMSADV